MVTSQALPKKRKQVNLLQIDFKKLKKSFNGSQVLIFF